MANKKEFYIGIDVGKASCGVACCDSEYRIVKYNGKECWVSRLFEPAKTAKDRRNHRGGRRIIERRRKRILYLRELFADEINKLDKEFFKRMDSSALYSFEKRESFLEEHKKLKLKSDDILTKKDRGVEGKFSLFNDANYTDKDYFRDFPTIYHLRKYLSSGELYNKEKERYIPDNPPHIDCRHFYLACEHIIKHRGNFLFKMGGISNVKISKLFQELEDLWNEVYEDQQIHFNVGHINDNAIDAILKEENYIKELKKKLNNEINKNDNEILKKIIEAVCGAGNKLEIKIGKEKKEYIDFSENESGDKIVEILMKITSLIKFRSKIQLKEEETISDIFIKHYLEYKPAFETFKKYLYDKTIVYTHQKKGWEIKINSMEKITIKNSLSQYLSQHLATEGDEEKFKKINFDVSSLSSLASLNKNLNIPSQYHRDELDKILSNQYLTLSKINIDKEKIKQIHDFVVPYYVGVLSKKGIDNLSVCDKERREPWVVWKKDNSNTKIRPWNFWEYIDKNKTAENFILRMINECSYLLGEKVLPKESLLWTKYLFLNIINKTKINGGSITNDVKKKIYEVWENGEKIDENYVVNICKKLDNNLYKDLNKEGVKFPLNKTKETRETIPKSPRTKFKDIQKEINLSDDEIEDIIKVCTIMPTPNEASEFLISKNAKLAYVKKDLVKLSFSGWGTFSKKLLELEVTKNDDGEVKSIIKWMEETNYSFMEIYSDKFNTKEQIEQIKKEYWADKNVNSVMTFFKYYKFAPSFLRRSLNEAVKCVDEYMELLAHDSKKLTKIFIENTREDDISKKGKETETRRKTIEKIYESIKASDKKNELKTLEDLSDEKKMSYMSDKYYLYLMQNGKDIYDKSVIKLNNFDEYEIDHIIPQSYTLDNSLDNRVLTKRDENGTKIDNYPIVNTIGDEVKEFWKILLKNNLMSKKKYVNLTNRNPPSLEFINRDITANGQIVKIIQEYFKINKKYMDVEVFAVKPKIVSICREKVFNWTKERNVDDFHHAEDAYFNIICGDILSPITKKIQFIKQSRSEDVISESIKKHHDEEKENNSLGNYFIRQIKDKTKEKIDIIKSSLESGKIFITRLPYENKKDGMNQVTLIPANKQKETKTAWLKKKKSLLPNTYGYYKSSTVLFWSIININDTVEVFPIKYHMWQKELFERKLLNNVINNELRKHIVACIYNISNGKEHSISPENVKISNVKLCSIFESDYYGRVYLGGGHGEDNYISNACTRFLSKGEREEYSLLIEFLELVNEKNNTFPDTKNLIKQKYKIANKLFNKTTISDEERESLKESERRAETLINNLKKGLNDEKSKGLTQEQKDLASKQVEKLWQLIRKEEEKLEQLTRHLFAEANEKLSKHVSEYFKKMTNDQKCEFAKFTLLHNFFVNKVKSKFTKNKIFEKEVCFKAKIADLKNLIVESPTGLKTKKISLK